MDNVTGGFSDQLKYESKIAYAQRNKKTKTLEAFVDTYPRKLSANVKPDGFQYDLKQHFKTLIQADKNQVIGRPKKRGK